MLSINLKKKVAVLLTGAMVLGMTTTAFAETGSVDTSGTGQLEGHVSRNVVDVTLPTDDNNAFDFIMDSEGLIQETEAAAYSGYTFPNKQGDGYVYFLNGDKTYGNDSTEFIVSNNSSVSVNVTVKAKAVFDNPEATGNVTLVGSKGEATGDKAKLYLGLVVSGNETKPITVSEASTKVELAGKPDNYYVSYNGVGAEPKYQLKLKDAKNKLTWETVGFKVEGATNEVENAQGVIAPKLQLTWEFEDLETAAAAAAAEEEAAAAAAAITEAKDAFLNTNPVAIKTVETVVAGDLAAITAAQTAFEALTDEVKTALAANDPAVTATTLAALKAKCDTLQIQAGYGQFSGDNSKVWLALTADGGIADASKVTSVKLAGNTVAYAVQDGWILVTWQQMKTAGATWDAAGTYSFAFVYDGITYTADVNPR
jgi:hypothetical protein